MPVAKSTLDDEKTEIRLDAALPQAAFTGYPCLELVGSSSGGTRFPLASGKNSIGRSNENDIVLDDSSVSRRHAVIELTDHGALVSDLGSRNGTKLDSNRITKSTLVPHGARVKVGVYELKFLAHEGQASTNVIPLETNQEPEAAPFEESEAQTPVDSQAGAEESGYDQAGFAPVSAPSQVPQEYSQEAQVTVVNPSRKKWLYLGLIIVLAVSFAFGGLKTWKTFNKLLSKKTAKKTEVVVKPDQTFPTLPQKPVEPAPSPQQAPVPQDLPVFLDVSSNPLPAKVYFGDQLIGTTPLRLSTTLTTGKWYEARAVFDLPEFGDSREEKTKFSVPLDNPTSILPVVFNAKVGTFKVNALPRDGQLYLEGFVDQDPNKSKSVKLNQITFGQNIYLPQGRFAVEVKKNKQLSGSQTYLDEVVYRREFVLDQNQTNYTVEVREEDLKTFPAEITSQPTGANVFLDDKEVGVTPLKMPFPTGDHNLALRKEGYFDSVQPLRVSVNIPYVADIVMKTSEAGELINKADVLIKEERFAEALPVLVEAYSKNPGPRETAQISYLVGICYLRQKSYKDARDYFNKAMLHDDFKFHGKLGIASVSFEEGDKDRALQLIVEILTSSEDPRVRSDAGALFQRLSPLNSVMYVTTEPPGARIYVNGMEIQQQTPLILHDLGVGNFRIQARKDGFQEGDAKISLGVSEFKPIVIKLSPN
ncbi:MAG: PEGA domain-containing protein [Deltaproteobacteria bacterium]|nr:MAG: PEGA domain-containing protein [Deltaproteobacteria bacterium]